MKRINVHMQVFDQVAIMGFQDESLCCVNMSEDWYLFVMFD